MMFARPCLPRFRRFALLGLLCSFVAASAMSASLSQSDADMLKFLHNDLAKTFVLPEDLPLDAALRREADAMSAAHLSRIDRLLPLWLEEERAAQSADGHTHRSTEVLYALWARQLNEFALWQVEPGDPDYERATLAVLKSAPRICEHTGDNYREFSRRIERIQQMPAAQRSAALVTERQLLAHWGQARTNVPAWPDPPPQDAALALLKRPSAEGQRTALAPGVAAALLGREMDYAAMHMGGRCGLQQWWLQESLRHGAAQAAVLNNFRYGTLIFASEALNANIGEPSAKPTPGATDLAAYFPKFAARFAASGTSTILVTLDASGKALRASVAARQIEVQGIRSQRPVAFENIFDQAAVSYVLQAHRFDKPSGPAAVKLQIVWTMQDDAATSNPPKAGGQ